ncbi:hypothetical protein [Desulfosporosinus sp. I2]|uniref:hypothetical protein n=1 Tax=Desulfosporosinus sp. I2 TaxID=1617025 RepID=UPI0005EDE22D|nr:hypothetical protein [Desulfosporosinus sp. I2]
MRNIKNTFLVSALSLGLIVGAVGVAGAATSTDYQQKIAEWIKNDPNPMVMNTNSGATPVAAPATTPVPAPVATPAPTPVATPVAAPASTPVTVPAKTVTSAPVTTGQANQYHYNDGHSNMNPQQHQQLHNSMNGNGYNTNHNYNENHNTNMGENHMSGSQSGHE